MKTKHKTQKQTTRTALQESTATAPEGNHPYGCNDDFFKVVKLLLENLVELDPAVFGPLTVSLAHDRIEFFRAVERMEALSATSIPVIRGILTLKSCVSKWPGWAELYPNEFDPEGTALGTFYRDESRGRRINWKHAFLESNPERDPFAEEHKIARSYVLGVLGSRPNLNACFQQSDFTGGATTELSGKTSGTYRKLMLAEYRCSRRAWPLFLHAMGFNKSLVAVMSERALHEEESVSRFGICSTSAMTRSEAAYEAARDFVTKRTTIANNNLFRLVRKTAKTHRSIAKENSLNVYLQKGIDCEMRARLAGAGIDLTSQEVNQKLAYLGSKEWDSDDPFVTVDLRNASGNVFTQVVKRFTHIEAVWRYGSDTQPSPMSWYDLLNAVRSDEAEMPDGSTHRYEMFSSMGNCTTFPLETVIFAGLCVAAGAKSILAGHKCNDFAVYGDDIIVRKSVVGKLLKLIRHYGFSINKDKTFLEGPFRESCGSDFHNGCDVRPMVLDYRLNSYPEKIKFINLARTKTWWSELYARAIVSIEHSIPLKYRFYRPLDGDPMGAITDPDKALTSAHVQLVRNAGGRFRWQVFRQEPLLDLEDDSFVRRILSSPETQLYASLRGELPCSDRKSFFFSLPEPHQRYNYRTSIAWESYRSTSNWLPTTAQNLKTLAWPDHHCFYDPTA